MRIPNEIVDSLRRNGLSVEEIGPTGFELPSESVCAGYEYEIGGTTSLGYNIALSLTVPMDHFGSVSDCARAVADGLIGFDCWSAFENIVVGGSLPFDMVAAVANDVNMYSLTTVLPAAEALLDIAVQSPLDVAVCGSAPERANIPETKIPSLER